MANKRRVEHERAVSQVRHHRRERLLDLADSWREDPISLRILRGFLGVTFVYAGLQKLADPGFFRRGSITYIGSQLQGFSQGTPAGGLLRLLDKFPLLSGLAVALGELAIGLGALLGVMELAAAAGGFLISLVLALSASWHVYPYFLGSDSIYAVAWLSYAVAVRERASAIPVRSPARPRDVSDQRREFLRGGALAAVVAVGATIAAALGLTRKEPISTLPQSTSTPSTEPTGTGAGGQSGAPSPSPTHTKTKAPHSADAITTLDKLSVGDAVGFQAPDGSPAALVRVSQDQVVAFSRVCTHEGCLVQWDSGNSILVCPCHGAEFDPAQNGKVLRGPAYQPLPSVDVTVQSNGDITAV